MIWTQQRAKTLMIATISMMLSSKESRSLRRGRTWTCPLSATRVSRAHTENQLHK
jgi:hypothetical protein